jgi:hypothetical protein
MERTAWNARMRRIGGSLSTDRRAGLCTVYSSSSTPHFTPFPSVCIYSSTSPTSPTARPRRNQHSTTTNKRSAAQRLEKATHEPLMATGRTQPAVYGRSANNQQSTIQATNNVPGAAMNSIPTLAACLHAHARRLVHVRARGWPQVTSRSVTEPSHIQTQCTICCDCCDCCDFN